MEFQRAIEDAGFSVKQELVWNKNTFTLGRQDYQWKHEPCLYGWKEGEAHYFTLDRTNTTVINDPKEIEKMKKEELVELIRDMTELGTTIINENKPTVNDLHPTMKPLKLLAKQIANSSIEGQSVLDMFGGSGSTLMTCEQLNRRCYMMEYDPKYIDVIIDRWESMTGKKAEKLND